MSLSPRLKQIYPSSLKIRLQQVLISAFVLQSLGVIGLTVYFSLMRSVVPEDIQSYRNWEILECISMFLLAVGIGLLVGYWITSPILRLSQASRLLANGKQWEPLPEDLVLAELSVLAKSFNQVAAKLQQSTQQSEEKFAKIFRLNPDPVTIVNIFDGSYLAANEQFLALTGYTYDEIIGHTVQELNFMVHDEQAAEIHQLILNDRATCNYEMDLRTKSGRIVTGLLSSELIELEGEIYVLAVFKDISDRKRLESHLLKYERIVSATTDGISLVDRNYIYRVVNQTYLDLDKKTSAEIVGRSVGDRLGEVVFQTQVKPYLDRCLAGETIQYETWFDYPDKIRRFIRVTYSPYFELDDTISGVVTNNHDLTDFKLAEMALRESEENYRFIVEASEEGIWRIDGENKTTFVNASMANMLGYSIDEMLGSSLFDFMDAERREIAEKCIAERRLGIREVHDFKFSRKDGTDLWGIVSANPIIDATGRYHGSLAMITDITDRQKLEQIKDEFISVVSHELRTPLTAIRGSIGILETGIYENRPEKTKQMLQIALNNSDRLVRLVNDILNLERLQSGKAKLVMYMCNVAELMQQAIEAVQEIALQACIIIDFTPLSIGICASPDAIVQTLINLLSNAIKFSHVGSTVWLSAEVKESAYVVFSVKDLGRGIPADQLETIFGRFCQVDASDSRQKGGTGLGLAICQSIVQQHGGKIWTESIVGAGSTFYFTLPIAQPDT